MARFFCPTKLSENISETPEGYLLCLAVPIARTGVMEYGEGETPLETGDDGIVYVSRTADDIFNKKTMASFEGKSITIRHPEDFVTPYNWKELTKGTIHNVRKAAEPDDDGEEVLLADVLVTDAFAIGLVKNGLREVSCGYEAEYEQTGKGKGKQSKIVGNHLALVEEGRAGSSYAIRDHNRKVNMKEQLKKLLQLMSRGKTVDQALAEMDKGTKKKKVTESKEVTDAKKIIADAQKVIDAAAKRAKSKDEGGQTAKKTAGSETNVVMDEESQKSYDAMKAACDQLKKQMDALMKPAKDESEEEESEDESEEEESEDESEEGEESEESKDEDEDAEILERVKALEVALSKLLESGDESEEEESEDESEEGEESGESEDEDLEGGEEKKKKVGDAARAEILVPGFEAPKKGDLKAAALRAAMKDDDTKEIILALNGGKKPTFDSAEKVSMLFIAASEMVKAKNGNGLKGTKAVDSKAITFDSHDSTAEDMTPEKMNAMNEAHYNASKK